MVPLKQTNTKTKTRKHNRWPPTNIHRNRSSTMKTIQVKDLKKYLDQCPDAAEVILGIKMYQSNLVDILKSPISDDKIILADKTYLKDLKEIK